MLADLENRKPDAVYCLGDLVGYNVWPNEVTEILRRRGIATLAGNHDLKVQKMVTTSGSLKEGGKNYAYHLVSPENRDYLLTLPRHIRLEYRLNHDTWNIVLAHGSTRSIDEYVLEDLDESYVLGMMAEAKADILCVGHSHKPYHRIIRQGDTDKHVINTGSVGKPKDGNPMGCYVMVTIHQDSNLTAKETIEIEFCRFAYDVEQAAKAIEDSPLPDEFADRLRKAY
ncbi:metallophosphoesterase family protein [Mucilaginibacter sp. PAMB04274]